MDFWMIAEFHIEKKIHPYHKGPYPYFSTRQFCLGVTSRMIWDAFYGKVGGGGNVGGAGASGGGRRRPRLAKTGWSKELKRFTIPEETRNQ